MNRPAGNADEVYARSFEETYHRFEVVAYGNTPFEALTSLAQEGVTLPNFQTHTSRFLQTYPCQLTLVDVDFGFNALVEEGPSWMFHPQQHMVQSDPYRTKNLMGRLGTLGMHVIGLPQAQSRTVVCGNHRSVDFASSTNSTQNSTTTLGYLKLRSTNVTSLPTDRPLVVYNYYEPTVASTQTPLMVPNAFNSPIRIRFSYPLQRFESTALPPPTPPTPPAPPPLPDPITAGVGFLYDPAHQAPKSSWRLPDVPTAPGLMFLDDWRLNYTNYQKDFDEHAPVLSEFIGDADPGMLDVSVAAAIDCIKLPIRLLFQIRSVVRAVQPHEPNYK